MFERLQNRASAHTGHFYFFFVSSGLWKSSFLSKASNEHRHTQAISLVAEIGKRAALPQQLQPARPQQLQQVRLPVNGDSEAKTTKAVVTNSVASHLQDSRATPPHTRFANSNHAVTNSDTSPQEAQTRASWFVNHFQVKAVK
jgi:hypothetical protein